MTGPPPRPDNARMRTRLALLLAILSACRPAPGAQQPEQDEPEQGVIVQVNRNLEVRGYLRLEDEDHITILTLNNELERFPKSRILKIVRLVTPEPAQAGTVFLRDGQRRTGIILEDSFDRVVLEIEGLRSVLPRDSVDYVILDPTFEQRYRRYKEALRPNVPQEHLDLCQWLIELRRYDLARQELIELLRNSPTPEAQQMLRLVEAQLALGHPPPAEEEGDDDLADPEATGPLPDRILSYDDVNLIRVYEIDFARPPKVSIDADTIRALIEQYGTSRLVPATAPERQALYRADPLEVAELMFNLRARELYPKIKVLNEPWALNVFRRRVHDTWLLNNCATSRCHGGPDAGRFFLYRDHYKDPRVRYSNLLILERLVIDPDWPLINYVEPGMSLIVQYGLPQTSARKPHPDVKGWKPVFGPGSQRMLQDTMTWIELMMKPRPQYPVVFDPGAPPPDPPAAPAEGPPEPDSGRTPR